MKKTMLFLQVIAVLQLIVALCAYSKVHAEGVPATGIVVYEAPGVNPNSFQTFNTPYQSTVNQPLPQWTQPVEPTQVETVQPYIQDLTGGY